MTAPHSIIIELTRLRKQLGLTHSDIHAITGLARSTIRNWEAGRRSPSLDALDAYLRAMGGRLTFEQMERPTDTAVVEEQLPFGELVLDRSEKFCRGCQQVRRRVDFHSDRSRGDGLSPRCKWCVSERRKEQRQRRTERQQRKAA